MNFDKLIEELRGHFQQGTRMEAAHFQRLVDALEALHKRVQVLEASSDRPSPQPPNPTA
jgi:uncharacterized protein YdcH (DUF465 family)